jgi:hypothetical protein
MGYITIVVKAFFPRHMGCDLAYPNLLGIKGYVVIVHGL